MGLLLVRLLSRGMGFPERCVFESGRNGLARGGISVCTVGNVPVSGGKSRERIRPLPLVDSHQVKKAALL
jgi:hypothetical protein